MHEGSVHVNLGELCQIPLELELAAAVGHLAWVREIS